MNGFLLVARCPMDDVPAGLYSTRQEAFESAFDVRYGDILLIAQQVIGNDVSSLIALGIVEFRNGQPQEMEIVRTWDENGTDDTEPELDRPPLIVWTPEEILKREA